MGLQLVHKTNYWGKALSGRGGDADTGELELLWAQAVRPGADGLAAPCCGRFGARAVWLSAEALRAQHDGAWELWHVGGRDGSNKRAGGHRFHKFVLAAAGAAEETEQVWQPYDPDEGYESDDGSVVTVYRHAFPAGWRTHWVLLGRGRLRRALGPLDAALPAFWAEERREGLTVHCHVGVLLPAATLRVS